MPIKLDKYTLPEETIDLMKSILYKSRQKQSELGFTLCSDKRDNIQARNICIGEACGVKIEEKCDEKETYVGTYHTHLYLSLPSAGDLIKCGSTPNICIGGQRDNKIRCYTWQHGHISNDKYEELGDLYRSGVKEIDNSAHKVNFECIKDFSQPRIVEQNMPYAEKFLNDLKQDIQKEIQEKAPQSIIKFMKNNLESEVKRLNKMLLDSQKETIKLAPKYYKENLVKQQ